jgi:hypothetical protein
MGGGHRRRNKLRVVAEFDPARSCWASGLPRRIGATRVVQDAALSNPSPPPGALSRPSEGGPGEGLLAGSPPRGIRVCTSSGPGEVLKPGAWRTWMDKPVATGWELEQIEFRHNRFETDEAGRPRKSLFYAAAHLSRPSHALRAIIEGDLVVDWKPGPAVGRWGSRARGCQPARDSDARENRPRRILNECVTRPGAFLD